LEELRSARSHTERGVGLKVNECYGDLTPVVELKPMAASFPKLRTVLFLLLLTSPIHGQSGKRFALLPQGEISAISRLCSRNGPKVNGSWEPTDGQIKSLEQHLSQISRLKSEEGMVGIQIAKPSRYYRQYVGIVVGGRKLIYLNAFDTIDQPPPQTGESGWW
jgi:hypothetical protein